MNEIIINDKGFFKRTIQETPIPASAFPEFTNQLPGEFEIVDQMHNGEEKMIFLRGMSNSRKVNIYLRKFKSLTLYGEWVPLPDSSYLAYKAVANPNNSPRPGTLTMSKEIPLAHYLALVRTPGTEELYLITNREMQGLEGDNAAQYMVPAGIPNVHGEGRYCTGDVAHEWDGKFPWTHNIINYTDSFRQNRDNADLSSDIPTLWKCDAELNLVLDFEEIFNASHPASNPVTTAINSMIL